MDSNQFYTIALAVCNILLGILLIIVVNTKRKKVVHTAFAFVVFCLMICCLGQYSSLVFADAWHIEPVYFDYFVYIGTCFLPVAFLFFSISFAKTKFKFKRKRNDTKIFRNYGSLWRIVYQGQKPYALYQ